VHQPMTDADTPERVSGADLGGTQVRRERDATTLLRHEVRLVVVRGPNQGLERQIAGPRLTIGTSPNNDLVLEDLAVSRHHCEIQARDDGYRLRDLGSTNGTEVNGTAIVEALLAPGAQLHIGDTEILFLPRLERVPIGVSEQSRFGALVGASAAMREVFALLDRIAATDLSCVLLGETGTGKELAARAIHEASPRAGAPFVVVDCGTVRDTLVESELFGHERGAFTGADRRRVGAFEAAAGGTVLLDEIGELPIELQPKLLRVLERREIKRLGSTSPIDIDVRILAATHRELGALVAAGGFREDLFYRLAEVVVALPPLRARLDDLRSLVTHLLDEEARAGRAVRAISDAALAALTRHSWPGNVRELRNLVRRATALAGADTIEQAEVERLLAMTRAAPARGAAEAPPVDATLSLKEARARWSEPLEKRYFEQLLAQSDGDILRAASTAEIHPKSLERLLRQHGLWPPAGRRR